MTTKPHEVLVVGGGAAGVITAATLLRDAATRPDEPGRGDDRRAVGGARPRAGLRHQRPAAPAQQLRRPDERPRGRPRPSRALVPRAGAGRRRPRPSSRARPTAATSPRCSTPRRRPPAPSLTRIHDEVVDLAEAGSTYVATLRSGVFVTADAVVLALGNPPPRRPQGLDVEPERLVVDPWAPGLLDRVGESDRVLLVGTGLTTVDVAAQISSSRPRARLTATSRHGLLPLRHLPQASRPGSGARRRRSVPRRRPCGLPPTPGRGWRLAMSGRVGEGGRQRPVARAVARGAGAVRPARRPPLGDRSAPDGTADGGDHRRPARHRPAAASSRVTSTPRRTTWW